VKVPLFTKMVSIVILEQNARVLRYTNVNTKKDNADEQISDFDLAYDIHH